MHQMRPLVSPRCITVIHDTTQLRTAPNRAVGRARLAYLRRVARASLGIITVSEWSRDRIMEDLGIPERRLRVVGNPADAELGRRIRRLRDGVAERDVILYVGGFAPHKNLPRLLAAFARSEAHATGAELVLVGGRPEEARRLRATTPRGRVRVLERCPQDELEMLFARARIVVQPSLEEGFGLPVWEAMAAGIPVCASTAGALGSVAAGAVESFDPTDADAIADALDRAYARADGATRAEEEQTARRFLAGVPTPADFADRFEAAALDLLGAA
jgi:alpha-1,3-rhamnosyl/mannosyltransferase